ncbi:MAG: hypothetical protein AB1798_07575, partial [Spirochaetota bacterium]
MSSPAVSEIFFKNETLRRPKIRRKKRNNTFILIRPDIFKKYPRDKAWVHEEWKNHGEDISAPEISVFKKKRISQLKSERPSLNKFFLFLIVFLSVILVFELLFHFVIAPKLLIDEVIITAEK